MNQVGNQGAPYGAPNENKDSKKNLLTIAGIAIALLLGTNIFLLMSKNKTSNELAQTTTTLDSKEALLKDVQKQFDDAIAQLDQSKSSNTELNAIVEQQKAQLVEQKSRIEKLAGDSKKLASAREELGRMRAQVDGYLEKIKQLEGDKEALTAANTLLGQEKVKLSTDLGAKTAEAADLTTAKAALVSEKEQLTTTNSFLAKKVDIASVIKVQNVVTTLAKVTDSGKEKKRKKAKNIDRVKICFDASANRVAEAGNEKFYVKVLDPTGTVLAIESLGSGVATDKDNSTEFRYTTVTEVDYANKEQNVCAMWQPGQDFSKGVYKIEIYNKGYLCGTGEFKMK
jgi:hypothetical protein